ncbi:2-oxoglutarate-dependent dioxygenase 19-like [Humulus lupulus]|uniref:2-oxoglutarate-dependent dioxygenase 19-like n=1 Tax=Humulus lupulus TaxID=3486 RepID=UPI002B40FB4A|nr:2-oxoglutarate-dependent dioxygenase 19-like [Humulus lupulus]
MAGTDHDVSIMSVKVVSDDWLDTTVSSSLASKYEITVKPSDEEVVDSNHSEYSIPTIDISLLTSGDLHQRSKILHDLRKACKEWGFFQLANHGISDSVMKKLMEACESFFSMTEEEKIEFQGSTDVMEPINYGTNFDCNAMGSSKYFIWRAFIKMLVHPQFHSPYKPQGFSEAVEEYCERTREISTVLMRAISETLGLEANCLEKATNWDEGLHLLASNYYPPCPDPDQALGLLPHTDSGLINFIFQNDVGGLQILHKGKYVRWKAMPNTIIVDLGDHMQILSNDLYKSVTHRAVVNNKNTRISIVSGHGPAADNKVAPIPELLEALGQAPAYPGIPYKEYLKLRRSPQSVLKATLDIIRLKQ